MENVSGSSIILALISIFNDYQFYCQTLSTPQIYSKYDFLPGEKVIFPDDFTGFAILYFNI